MSGRNLPVKREDVSLEHISSSTPALTPRENLWALIKRYFQRPSMNEDPNIIDVEYEVIDPNSLEAISSIEGDRLLDAIEERVRSQVHHALKLFNDIEALNNHARNLPIEEFRGAFYEGYPYVNIEIGIKPEDEEPSFVRLKYVFLEDNRSMMNTISESNESDNPPPENCSMYLLSNGTVGFEWAIGNSSDPHHFKTEFTYHPSKRKDRKSEKGMRELSRKIFSGIKAGRDSHNVVLGGLLSMCWKLEAMLEKEESDSQIQGEPYGISKPENTPTQIIRLSGGATNDSLPQGDEATRYLGRG